MTSNPAVAATRTIAFGADTKHAPGNTAEGEANMTKLESEIGRKLAFTRDYLLWDSAFPTGFETWLEQRGTIPMVSVMSRLTNGTVVPWASVASAQPGSTLYSQIVSWANRIKAFGYPVYFTYTHEPEAASNQSLGTATDYIAAWRHVHDIFVAQGVTNVRFIWIMTDWSFRVPSTDRRYAWKWYPGDAYVDDIAADAYNWYTCRSSSGSWQTLAKAISGFMTFGGQHPSKPMWLTEYASVENPNDPTAKANWIAQAETMLQQPAYSQIAGVAWFNIVQSRMSTCNWPVESSTAATAAFTTMGQDPFFQGSADFTAAATPPPTSISFAGASSTTGNSTTETVPIPDAASAGDGLVMIATSGAPTVPTAPAGWTQVASAVSQQMATAVWQRVATATDPGRSVSVGFGGTTKGSVEVLDYSGTSAAAPVSAALAATNDTSSTAVSSPKVSATNGGLAVSYWAVRTSVDTTLTPPSDVVVRSSEAGTGGGRVISASADGAPGTVERATVNPAVGHSVSWQIALAPAS